MDMKSTDAPISTSRRYLMESLSPTASTGTGFRSTGRAEPALQLSDERALAISDPSDVAVWPQHQGGHVQLLAVINHVAATGCRSAW
jgi:hypothetical protein